MKPNLNLSEIYSKWIIKTKLIWALSIKIKTFFFGGGYNAALFSQDSTLDCSNLKNLEDYDLWLYSVESRFHHSKLRELGAKLKSISSYCSTGFPWLSLLSPSLSWCCRRPSPWSILFMFLSLPWRFFLTVLKSISSLRSVLSIATEDMLSSSAKFSLKTVSVSFSFSLERATNIIRFNVHAKKYLL